MLQVLRSLCCQLVSTNATIGGGNAPLRFDQLFFQEPLESRIQRAFFDLKQIVGRSLDVLRERVPMQRLPLQRSENHHLQRAGKKVSFLSVFHGWEIFSKP